MLLETYYISCNCLKCRDVAADNLKSSLICPKCQGCVPSSTGACISCKHQIDSSLIEKHANLKIKIKSAVSKDYEHQMVLMVYEKLFKQAVAIFHPYDSEFYSILEILYKKRSYADKYKECLVISRLMLTNIYQNCPHYCLIRGLHEMMFAILCNGMNLVEEAELHINRAKDIFKVTHGDDHPILTKYCGRYSKEIEWNQQDEERPYGTFKKLDALQRQGIHIPDDWRSFLTPEYR